MISQNKTLLWTLSLLPIFMVLGNSALIPLLPNIQKSFMVSDIETSYLITSFSLSAAIFIPFIGVASDRFGRKRVILVGLLLFAAGSLWAGIASWLELDFSMLLYARALQGLGGAATSPIAMVLAGDLFQGVEKTKAMGILESANSFGKVLSPFLGVIIGQISWIVLFFFFPVLSIPLFFLVQHKIVEPTISDNQHSFREYGHQIASAFRLYGRWLGISYLLGALVLFLFFGYYAKMSDQWDASPLSFWIKGLLLTTPLVGQCLGAFWTGRKVKSGVTHLKNHLYLGLCCLSLGVGLIGIFSFTPWLGLFSASLIGVGAGLALPCLNILITSAIRRSERGIVTSLYHSVRFLGVAVGPPILSMFGREPVFHFGIVGLLGLIAWSVASFLHPPQRVHGGPEQSRILLRKSRLHLPAEPQG
ncbi:MFS transporter [Risungbinella massiliensis]|uniref:MFS transporter n=1 Tax=Risungbinella massiliensis TaxID=1329796 RepID=UPI00069BFC57|nr:MFS transporter [Risungbinella massiliensis]